MENTNERWGQAAAAPEGVRVTDVTGDVGVDEARSRFGGVDIPATLAGTLAALGAAVLLGASAGAEYDVFRNVNLPQWFDADALTGAALATGLLALAVMFGAGWVGGRLGERYHRRADSVVAHNRPGGVGAPRRIVRAS